MANPVKYALSKGQIYKICTNVTKGWLRNITRDAVIFYTTRNTGEAAPSALTFSDEAVQLFALDGINEDIKSDVAIDIYVSSPAEDAIIRIDL